ncbi:MAG: hypothetical protein N2D54_11885, partial [Chloroflexota bacterium]
DVVSTLNPEYNVSLGYLFWGVIGFTIGMLLIRGTAPPPQESQRFRLVRKIFGGKPKEEETE